MRDGSINSVGELACSASRRGSEAPRLPGKPVSLWQHVPTKALADLWKNAYTIHKKDGGSGACAKLHFLSF